MMVPRALKARTPHVDVTAAMEEQPRSRSVSLKVVGVPTHTGEHFGEADPFAEVEV
jgi:hypothetical protein